MTATKTSQKILVFSLLASLTLGLLILLWPRLSHADNVIAGFSSKDTLQPGMIVAIDKNSKDAVKLAPADQPGIMYGVVVDPSDAPITLVGKDSKVFVATTGTYQVLTSVANGPIKSGDLVSMSGINGIAAKAIPGQPLILGRAASDFSGKQNVITTNDNKAIGRVFVTIGIQKNPLTVSDPTVPTFLRKVANGLGNRSVPVIRVYTALLIFMISLLSALTILWSGVRTSLTSLGRNPLSRKAIFSGMYKTILSGVGIFIIGLAGVYLLLRI